MPRLFASMKAGFAIATAFAVVASLAPPYGTGRDQPSPTLSPVPPTVLSASRPLDTYAHLPPVFVPNEGQTAVDVLVQSQGAGYSFGFATTGARFAFAKDDRGIALDMRFVGASPRTPTAQRPAAGKVNYFIGNDPAGWRTGLPTYEELVYADLWPGIDLVFRGTGGQLKYEFYVRPGATVEDIRFRYQGADALSLDHDGSLRIITALGVLTDQAPMSYQEIAGKRIAVDSRFVLDGDIAFAVGPYAADHPLIIDPGLIYSTLLGGMGADQGRGIAVDASGSAVVTGLTQSMNFPTTVGADQILGDGQDAFVTKLNSAGSGQIFSTYLGGTAGPGSDAGHAVAVDGAGNLFVTGITSSTDFPATLGAYDMTYNGSSDAFVTKFSPAGILLASTYLGGTGSDQGFGIAVDGSGNPLLTGVTAPTGLPTTPGAYDTTHNGLNDAYVTKLASTLSGPLMYSTYLGGSGQEIGQSIALDAAGMAVVTGMTSSSGAAPYPTTPGAYQMTYGGGTNDAFVTKLNLTGSALVYSTFLGGTTDDQGFGVAVTVLDAVVAGQTNGGFPTTAGAFDITHNGATDVFVARLNSAGSALVYSTYLGGSSIEDAKGLALDAMARPTVTGSTLSSNFPTTCGAVDTVRNGFDVYMSRLDASGSGLIYSTFLGGTSTDNAFATTVDSTAAAYVTGSTTPFGATSYPTTPGAFDTDANGSTDAFVTKLDMLAATMLTLSPPTDTNVVDEQHMVTARLTGVTSGPCANVTIYFTVLTAVATAASPSSGQDDTDANGEATFTYSAALPGMDTIYAFADLNDDGDQDPDEPFATATKFWTVPPSEAFCDVTITNGGWLFAMNGDRASFGGNAKLDADGNVQGQEEYQDHGPLTPRNVHSTELLATTCDTESDPKTGTIYGEANVDGSDGIVFRIKVTDGGPGGSNDSYGILMSDGYASGEQELQGGNVNIHKN